MLRDHQGLQQRKARGLGLGWSEDWLVFCYPDGSPFVPDRVSKAFLTVTRKAGIKGVNLKMLRHTHATLLLEQGVHQKVLQERLGHANVGVTLDIYSHVSPSMQREAALKFEEVVNL